MDESKGLYRKYTVHRTDGRDRPGEKHDRCWYFVLDIRHDEHARAALAAYAESCRDDYPELSSDLTEQLRDIPYLGGGPHDAD